MYRVRNENVAHGEECWYDNVEIRIHMKDPYVGCGEERRKKKMEKEMAMKEG